MQAFTTGRGKGRGRISRVSAVLARASGSAASLKQHSTGDNLDERFLVGDGPGMGGCGRKEEVRKEGNMVSVTGLCRRQKDNTLLEYCNKYYLTFQGLTIVGALYSTSLDFVHKRNRPLENSICGCRVRIIHPAPTIYKLALFVILEASIAIDCHPRLIFNPVVQRQSAQQHHTCSLFCTAARNMPICSFF